MGWGGPDVQPYYRQGRGLQEIMRSQIDTLCGCGYIMLKATNDFEKQSGGLEVKRSQVRIIDDKTGRKVIKLRPKGKEFLKVWSCNACVNDWK